MNNKNEDSFLKKYISKLLAQIFMLVLGFVSVGIIPRALGSKQYGDVKFLQDFFQKVLRFLDIGSSTHYYNKLSRNKDNHSLTSFYLRIVVAIFAILLLFIFIAGSTGLYKQVWPGQKISLVFVVGIWGLFSFLNDVVYKIMDAHGLTVASEKIKIASRAFAVILIVVLFITNNLTPVIYLLCELFSFILVILINLLKVSSTEAGFFKNSWRLSKNQNKEYKKSFINYSSPLLLLSVIVLLVGVIERWFLQKFSGSMEQGYFGLSQRLSQISSLFTLSIVPLLLREFSIAFGKKNYSLIGKLFSRYIPMLYSLAVYFSSFVAVNSRFLLKIIGGEEFSSAMIPVIIMAYFPAHQTYGQLSGSVFLVTENTKIYRNIGIFSMGFNLLLSYFLIAPSEIYGLGLGAIGLAISMVVSQIVSVNVQLYYNSKLLKLKFYKYFLHQFIVIIIFSSLAWFITFFTHKLNMLPILSFLSAGVIYSIVIIITIMLFPKLIGLSSSELKDFISKIKRRFI